MSLKETLLLEIVEKISHLCAFPIGKVAAPNKGKFSPQTNIQLFFALSEET